MSVFLHICHPLAIHSHVITHSCMYVHSHNSCVSLSAVPECAPWRCALVTGQQHIPLEPFLCFLHCVQCRRHGRRWQYIANAQHPQVHIHTTVISKVRETVVHPAITMPWGVSCTAPPLTESTVLDDTNVGCVALVGIVVLKINISLLVTALGEHWCQGGRPDSSQAFIRIAKGSSWMHMEHGAHRVAL